MRNWIYACDCEDIDEEDLVRWDHADQSYAIYRIDQGFFCTAGYCTHEQQHLEMGLVFDDVIECPLHQGRFNIVSGKAISPPVCVDLKTFKVKVEDSKVYVDVGE